MKSMSGVPWLSVCFVVVVVSSCATGKLMYHPSPQHALHAADTSEIVYSIYGLGDAGKNDAQSKAVLSQLAQETALHRQPGSILFLGDNIYPAGLAPPTDQEAYAYGMHLLREQVDALQDYEGNIIFIPGNHDWNEFKPGGLAAIQRQGEALASFGRENLTLLPAAGCPGPEVIELNSGLVMIIIDSQWWIQTTGKTPEQNDSCAVREKEAFLEQLQIAVDQHADKQLIIALHHPMLSRGPHGGFYTVRDHLFPLSKVVSWLYIPLPVIGSIYPGYRSILGHPQDIKNKRYHSLRDELNSILEGRKDVIFLSGHDHNLQYIRQDGQHYIISGSGSKLNAIANGGGLVYGHKAPGFVRLDYYQNGSVGLVVFEVDVDNNSRKRVVEERIIPSK